MVSSKTLFAFFGAALFATQAHAAATLPADLTLALAADAEVQAGQDITYDIDIDNIGESSVLNTTLSLILPTQGSFVSIDAGTFSCTALDNFAPGDEVTCALGAFAPNAPVAVQLIWEAPQAETTLTLTALVEGDGDDGTKLADNEAQVSTDVFLPPADGGGCSLQAVAPGHPGTLGLLGLLAAGFASVRLHAKRRP